MKVGRRILHTGALGSASTLKVMTNYLATANLVTLCEALITMDLVRKDIGLFQAEIEDDETKKSGYEIDAFARYSSAPGNA